MTTEQAADKLGMVAVVWPRATEARRAELYAGLNADQREAVRVLFGEGESEPEPQPAPADTSTDDLIAALQSFTRSIKREKSTVEVQSPAEVPQTASRSQDSIAAGMLRQLAEEIEKRQAVSQQPEAPKPVAPKRQRADYSAQLAAAKVTAVRDHPIQHPPAAPRTSRVVNLLPPPARLTAPADQLYMGGTAEDWAKVRRAGNLATIQAVLFILAVIAFPVLIIWLASQ